MPYSRSYASVWSSDYFDNLINCEIMTSLVTCVYRVSRLHLWNFLTNLRNFRVLKLSFLIYYFQSVFVNLQNQSTLFTTAKIYKVTRKELPQYYALLHIQSGD